MKRSKSKTTLAGAIAQLLVLGFAASVLVTVLSFIFWAIFVQKQGFPIEWIFIIQLIVGLLIGLKLILIKGTRQWSHPATFGVLFGGLCVCNIACLYSANRAVEKESGGDWDARKMLISALEDYEKNTKACLKYFESVTNRESAQQTIIPLTSQLSSLGGTVRSFSLRQREEVADLVKEAENRVQEMNKRLKASVEKAQQRAGDNEEFKGLCERYLQLIARVERKEHLESK